MIDADINEYEWINTYLEQIQQPFEMISKNLLRIPMSPNQYTRDKTDNSQSEAHIQDFEKKVATSFEV